MNSGHTNSAPREHMCMAHMPFVLCMVVAPFVHTCVWLT